MGDNPRKEVENMFYVMFWPDWLAERMKGQEVYLGGRYSNKWNWFEFEKLEDAKAFLSYAENGYIKFDRDNSYAPEDGRLGIRYNFSGPIFTGQLAA